MNGLQTYAEFLGRVLIAAALLFHLDFAQQMQMIMFLKNFAIAGGFLVIFAYGPGPISLDRRKASA